MGQKNLVVKDNLVNWQMKPVIGCNYINGIIVKISGRSLHKHLIRTKAPIRASCKDCSWYEVG